MNDIRNYRGIALSSLLSKLFEYCIIGNQQESLRSNNLQFAYKSKISSIHCVNSVNETVNYFINNSGKVYVCTLVASKAFDRVNLLTIFKNLIKRNMCPLFLRFLFPVIVIKRCILSGMLLHPALLALVMVINKEYCHHCYLMFISMSSFYC